MTNLCKLFGRHNIFEEKFQQLKDHSYTTDAELKDHSYTTDAELKGCQSRTQCKETTAVCRLLDAELPVWFEEST